MEKGEGATPCRVGDVPGSGDAPKSLLQSSESRRGVVTCAPTSRGVNRTIWDVLHSVVPCNAQGC